MVRILPSWEAVPWGLYNTASSQAGLQIAVVFTDCPENSYHVRRSRHAALEMNSI